MGFLSCSAAADIARLLLQHLTIREMDLQFNAVFLGYHQNAPAADLARRWVSEFCFVSVGFCLPTVLITYWK